jgi:hypothetical protein
MADASIPRLSSILQSHPDIGRALQYVQDVANNLGQQTNAAPIGAVPAPPPLAKLEVTGGAGIVHAVMHDPSPTYRGNSYHMEVIPADGNWETDAHPIHTGPARAYRGSLGPGTYHFRACSGYNTSNPSPWVYQNNVSANGNTPPPFPKSTGSGTGGGAWGSVPFDGTVPPKRS